MAQDSTALPLWGRFEQTLASSVAYENPLQEVRLEATFAAPSGRLVTVDGFWDGGTTWRLRFAPDEQGSWRYHTTCSDSSNGGLHGQHGSLQVGPVGGRGRFAEHGPIRLSDNRGSLAHADGTPFLWLADTAWNGPMMATDDEWSYYLGQRVRQGFTAVQWMASESLITPNGNREGQRMISGHERIAVNPAFFQRLDRKHQALVGAGLLSAPVLLWAAVWSNPEINARNPGYTLPEDQAILLARYMVARWGADPVVWILNGDGRYEGEIAARWRRIGRGVFGDRPHAPVMLHPCGMHLPVDEFNDESWLDVLTYQSGHGDDDPTLRWLNSGPPSVEWRRNPPRPMINLEPPYEGHIAYQSRQPFGDHAVRRTLYWSLLNAPTAGVTYGGHGVWGWDDGSGPPEAHPNTGTPLPWREALLLPGAEQIAHLAACFARLAWPELHPAQELLAHQPGEEEAARHIAAAQTAGGDAALIYTPLAQPVVLRRNEWRQAEWFNPRNGEHTAASADTDATNSFTPPDTGDWVLLLSNRRG